MSGPTAASEALLAEDAILGRFPDDVNGIPGRGNLQWLRQHLVAIEAAAIASVLDIDRVAAALHSRCVEEYAHAAKVDPTRLLTMHMADAHHDAAARVVAALTGGQG